MRCVYVVLLCAVLVYADEEYFRKLDSIVPEDACSSAGGICTFAEDCSNLTEEEGLCPNQRSNGVECCYGVSTKETRCSKNGGHCVTTSCHERLVFSRATDCAAGEKCCILV